MIVRTTTPRDDHDPGEVVGATCEHCHTEFARRPPERDCPRCMVCGATGCPECFHHGDFDTCDGCNDWICKYCYRSCCGFRVCPQPECAKAVRKIADEAREVARAYQKTIHPRRRTY